ncbi:MAG: putative rane protein [Labilithrix sp.]|nr:putative rane protein [Labilithrix sp.]
MTLTEDLRGIEDVDPSIIAVGIEETEEYDEDQTPGRMRRMGGRMRNVAQRIAPERSVISSALAMSAACLGSVLVASARRRGSPWAGLNAVSRGLGFGGRGLLGRRVSRRFDARLGAIGLGTIIGGSLVVAAIANRLTPSRGMGRIAGGILAAAGSYAMDRYLMKRPLLPALTRSLGRRGAMMKYGAIGLGSILGRRAR